MRERALLNHTKQILTPLLSLARILYTDVDSEREDESPSTSPKLLLSMGTGAGFLAVLLALVLRRAAKRAAAEMHKNDDDDDDAATVDEEDTASLP